MYICVSLTAKQFTMKYQDYIQAAAAFLRGEGSHGEQVENSDLFPVFDALCKREFIGKPSVIQLAAAAWSCR